MILPLSLPCLMTLDNFHGGSSNQEAFQWVTSWPAWPHHALALYGPAGVGKTHLGCIWKKLTQDNPHCLVIDAVQEVAETTPLTLLHTLNLCHETGGWALLLSQVPPARWGVTLPDLQSRLNALPAIAIAQADDQLLTDITLKLLSDLQLETSSETLAYILRYTDRSIARVKQTIEALNTLSLTHKRPLTIDLVKSYLHSLTLTAS